MTDGRLQEAERVYIILCAMRQYAPSDLLPSINEALARFATEFHLDHEGNGWTDTEARETINKALAGDF